MTRNALFIKQDFIMHSGEPSDYKIECDNLTDEDWETLAYLVSKKLKFSGATGVPTGGLKFAAALEKYATHDYNSDPHLICDDVLTTGKSMIEMQVDISRPGTIGVVVFARKPLDYNSKSWIHVMFQMWD